MKIFHIVLSFILYSLNSYSQKNSIFFIEGKIKGNSSGYLYLNYIDKEGKTITDTSKIQNGLFLFTGKINEPTYATIEGIKKIRGDNSNVLELFIEPDTISISLVENNYKNAIIKGSKTQDELTYLNKIKAIELPDAFILEEEFDKLREKMTRSKNENEIKSIYARQDVIRELLIPFKVKIKEINCKYITENPSSFLGPHFLPNYLDELPLDSLKIIYEKWDYAVRESRNGKFIAKEIRKKELSSIGRLAPDFYTKDINGLDIKLSSFKGKQAVLLDFWASWCVPCRNGNTHLISLYKKYKSKGLEIIGISYDNDIEAWNKAISQDSINIWRHVLVAKDLNNITSEDILNNYEGPYIPIKILINKEGIIVGKWVGESEESKIEIDNKLKELLN